MFVRAEGTQSGGAFYRSIGIRNLVCTACMVAVYVIKTVVVASALFQESVENNKVGYDTLKAKGYFECITQRFRTAVFQLLLLSLAINKACKTRLFASECLMSEILIFYVAPRGGLLTNEGRDVSSHAATRISC